MTPTLYLRNIYLSQTYHFADGRLVFDVVMVRCPLESGSRVLCVHRLQERSDAPGQHQVQEGRQGFYPPSKPQLDEIFREKNTIILVFVLNSLFKASDGISTNSSLTPRYSAGSYPEVSRPVWWMPGGRIPGVA